MKITKSKVAGMLLALVVVFTLGFVIYKNYTPEITATSDASVTKITQSLDEDITFNIALSQVETMSSLFPQSIKVSTTDVEELTVDVADWTQSEIIEDTDYYIVYKFTPNLKTGYDTEGVTLPTITVNVSASEESVGITADEASQQMINELAGEYGTCSHCGANLTKDGLCSVSGTTPEECDYAITGDVQSFKDANEIGTFTSVIEKGYDWYLTLSDTEKEYCQAIINEAISKDEEGYIRDLTCIPVNTLITYIDKQSDYNVSKTITLNDVAISNQNFAVTEDMAIQINEAGLGEKTSINDIFSLCIQYKLNASDFYDTNVKDNEINTYIYNEIIPNIKGLEQNVISLSANTTKSDTTYTASKLIDAKADAFTVSYSKYTGNWSKFVGTWGDGTQLAYYCAGHGLHLNSGDTYTFKNMIDKEAFGKVLYENRGIPAAGTDAEKQNIAVQIATWDLFKTSRGGATCPSSSEDYYNRIKGFYTANAGTNADIIRATSSYAVLVYVNNNDGTDKSALDAPPCTTSDKYQWQPLITGVRIYPDVYVYFDYQTNAAGGSLGYKDQLSLANNTNVPGHNNLHKTDVGTTIADFSSIQSVNISHDYDRSYGWEFKGWNTATDQKSPTSNYVMSDNLDSYSYGTFGELTNIPYITVYAMYYRQVTLNACDFNGTAAAGKTGGLQKTYHEDEWNQQNTVTITARDAGNYTGGLNYSGGTDDATVDDIHHRKNGWTFDRWQLDINPTVNSSYWSGSYVSTDHDSSDNTKIDKKLVVYFRGDEHTKSYQAVYTRGLVFTFDRNVTNPIDSNGLTYNAGDVSWKTSDWAGENLENLTVPATKTMYSLTAGAYNVTSWNYAPIKYRNACTMLGYNDPWGNTTTYTHASMINETNVRWARRNAASTNPDSTNANKHIDAISNKKSAESPGYYLNDHTFYASWQLDTTSVTVNMEYLDESDRYMVRPDVTQLLIYRDGKLIYTFGKDYFETTIIPGKETISGYSNDFYPGLDPYTSLRSHYDTLDNTENGKNELENIGGYYETFDKDSLKSTIAAKSDDAKGTFIPSTNPSSSTSGFTPTILYSYGIGIDTTADTSTSHRTTDRYPNSADPDYTKTSINSFTYIFENLQERSEIDNHTYQYTVIEAFSEPKNSKLQYSIQYIVPSSKEGQDTILKVLAGENTSILKNQSYLEYVINGRVNGVKVTDYPIQTVNMMDSSVTIRNNLNEPDIHTIAAYINIYDENDKYNFRPDFLYVSLYRTKIEDSDSGAAIDNPRSLSSECLDTQKLDIQVNSGQSPESKYAYTTHTYFDETDATYESKIELTVAKINNSKYAINYSMPYLYYDYSQDKNVQYAYFIEVQTDYGYTENGTIYPYTSTGEYSYNTIGSKTTLNSNYKNKSFDITALGSDKYTTYIDSEGNPQKQYNQDFFSNEAINKTVNNFTMPYYKETQKRGYTVRHILVEYEDKTTRDEYQSSATWTFDYNLNGSDIMPNTYSGANSPDDITGVSNDFWHTTNHLAFSSEIYTGTKKTVTSTGLTSETYSKNSYSAGYLYKMNSGNFTSENKQYNINDDNYLYNSPTHSTFSYQRYQGKATNSNYNNLLAKEKDETFLITLKQVKKEWTGDGYSSNLQENYNINSLTGNTYNVIVQANGNTNVEAIPDGVYEVETPHYDIDFAYESYTDYSSYISKQTSLIAYKSYVPSTKTEERNSDHELVGVKYDYSIPAYNYGQPVDYTSGQVFYNPVNGKYYVAFGSEYYHEVTGLTTLMNIDNWRGYVNDTYINNTSLNTSDFATDVDFRNK